jgi:tetratricopeptide (TPR) repeat protein
MKNLFRFNTIFFVLAALTMNIACSTGYNKHADKYFEEGMLFYERMEYDRSIESFDKTLELAPYGKDNNIVYYNRGMAHLRNRQFDKAIYDFSKSLEMTPASSKTQRYDNLVNRGEAYQKNNQLDLAVQDYSQAIELRPEQKNIKYIYANRAWVQYARGNYNDAIADFSESIKRDPEFDSAYFGRATVWQRMKDYQRALSDAKEAAKLKPAEKKYDDLLYEIKSAAAQQ